MSSSTKTPHLTIQQQISLLINRGLAVPNEAKTSKYLKHIGYYRLSGYWYPFRKKLADNMLPDNGYQRSEHFIDGAKFQDIIDLYVFDKKLRVLLLDAIERIEVSVRTNIAHLLGSRDPFAHLHPAQLHGHFVKHKDLQSNKSAYDKWLSNLNILINRSSDDFVNHYREKYGYPFPIWVVIELWDFGMLSKFYQGMRVEDKLAIAQYYGINDWHVMQSWLRCLNYIRNCVAHHNRIWNRNIIERPKLPKFDEITSFNHILKNTKCHTRIYIVFCILIHFVEQINPGSAWKHRVSHLIKNFPQSQAINIHNMGFPESWSKQKIWDLETYNDFVKIDIQ